LGSKWRLFVCAMPLATTSCNSTYGLSLGILNSLERSWTNNLLFEIPLSSPRRDLRCCTTSTMQVLRIQSIFVLLFAALSCLVTAMDGMMDDEEQYGIIMARVPLLYQEWALTKRDVCADAIPGTKTSICTPGNTLCCTPNNTNSAFPQCQTILSSGYCCISANACYIDTPSDCAASNSVPCSK